MGITHTHPFNKMTSEGVGLLAMARPSAKVDRFERSTTRIAWVGTHVSVDVDTDAVGWERTTLWQNGTITHLRISIRCVANGFHSTRRKIMMHCLCCVVLCCVVLCCVACVVLCCVVLESTSSSCFDFYFPFASCHPHLPYHSTVRLCC
jgi:hypothetical protein